jgi:hypothetical protein
VFALFWLIIAVRLELIALGPLFILFYVLVGATRAGELNPEHDYTDDYAAEVYPTPGSCSTDSEYLLDIAM